MYINGPSGGEHDRLRLTAQERAALFADFWNAVAGAGNYAETIAMRERAVNGYIADTVTAIVEWTEDR